MDDILMIKIIKLYHIISTGLGVFAISLWPVFDMCKGDPIYVYILCWLAVCFIGFISLGMGLILSLLVIHIVRFGGVLLIPVYLIYLIGRLFGDSPLVTDLPINYIILWVLFCSFNAVTYYIVKDENFKLLP